MALYICPSSEVCRPNQPAPCLLRYKPDTHFFGKPLHKCLIPVRLLPPQGMIKMDSHDGQPIFLCKPCQHMEQDNRIHTAGDTNHNSIAFFKHVKFFDCFSCFVQHKNYICFYSKLPTPNRIYSTLSVRPPISPMPSRLNDTKTILSSGLSV